MGVAPESEIVSLKVLDNRGMGKEENVITGLHWIIAVSYTHLEVPMLELYGYSTSLRSITGGSGEFEYVVSRYEQAPPDVQEKQIQDNA